MRPIVFSRIEIRRPRYDPHPEKSTTDNSSWRVGMFVIFTDYDGNEYDVMFRWDQLTAINQAREDVEAENKRLAAKFAR